MASLTRPLPLLLLTCTVACTIAACSRERTPAPATPAPAKPAPVADGDRKDTAAPAPATTRLTVYSGDYDALAQQPPSPGPGMPGFALVDTTLRYGLQSGPNTITLDRLPLALDVASVTLRGTTPTIAIQGQRYLAPPADAGTLLAGAVGQRVAVEHTSGNARQVDNGTLVAAGDGLTLALPDGRIKVINDYDNVSLLDPARQPAAEPTLRWQVLAQDAGTTGFDLAYATGGLAWRAEYLARLGKGADCTLSLDGAAMVANRSGMDFRNVALTLVAGEPNRVEPQRYARDGIIAKQAMAPPVVFDEPWPIDYAQPRRSGEYYAYPIPGRTTLDDAALERVPLFAPLASVDCERGYETEPAGQTWQPSQPVVQPGFGPGTGPQPVHATVSIANTKATGLGRPLPAGRVRTFDGEDFLGESQFGHTPEGADLHLEVGTTFDLTAERTRSDFKVDRAGRQMTESFSVTVRNAKQSEATVKVVEPLPRWSDWEIVASSVPAKKRDAEHVEFAVPVAAGSEQVLTYTVRYRWPAGVRP